MRNKLPAILAFLILLFLVIGWVFYSSSETFFGAEVGGSDETEVAIEQSTDSTDPLLQGMLSQEQKSYAYPTNEMILKYNFDRGVEPLRVFIEDLSEYRFYCINQLLLEKQIEYAYYKTEKVIKLVIFLSNKQAGQKILQDFEYYKIPYSFYNPQE